jgi:hypothetical protein
MLSAFRARAIKGLSRRAVLAMIGAAAALLVLLSTAFGGASAAPPPCDPAGTWTSPFSSTSSDPAIRAADNGTVTFTIATQNAGEGDDNVQADDQGDGNDDDNDGGPGGRIHFEWKTDLVTPSMAKFRGDGVQNADLTFSIKGRGTIPTAPPGYQKALVTAVGKITECTSGFDNTAQAIATVIFPQVQKKDTNVTLPFMINTTHKPPPGP